MEPRATRWLPFATRLRQELDALAKQADELVRASTIQDLRSDDDSGPLYRVMPTPPFAWGAPTSELRRMQIAITPKFDSWVERCGLIFADAPNDLRDDFAGKTAQIREWLARDVDTWSSGWHVPATIQEARTRLGEWCAEVQALIEIVAPDVADVEVVAVPDTSALMDVPAFERYPSVLGVATLEVIVVSGVLSELDHLKDQGRTQEAREKARAAGKALKAVRAQGNLIDGIALGGGVTLRVRPIEPRFEQLPKWLDKTAGDDRILAAAFELQRERPTRAVVLVTGDVNLQTKADHAQLPFVEPPTM